jgi:hypothetical protein
MLYLNIGPETMYELIKRLEALVEDTLDNPIVWERTQTSSIVRIALIRELALCGQILATLRDEGEFADCAGLMKQLKINGYIVKVGCDALRNGAVNPKN